MTKKNKPDDDRHPFAATEDRHPVDIRLRAKGFQIHSRLPGVEPVWTKGGRYYGQLAAEREAGLIPEQLPEQENDCQPHEKTREV